MKEQEKKDIKEVLGDKINDSRYRVIFYHKYGFTEEAKKDEYWHIRLEAYRHLGFTKEALNDNDTIVRHEAYLNLGYTEESKLDKDPLIRMGASLWFSI